VSDDEHQRTVTTLGSLKNSSGSCVEDIVIEVKYFDAKNTHIDTVTQAVYGLVVRPAQEVSFRVRDSAAKPKEAYASQTARVVSAEVRGGSHNKKPPSIWATITDLLISWGPMLLLMGVWNYFLRKMRAKDSPQARSLALIEQQNALFDSQNKLLERLIVASEAIAARNERGA